MPPAPGWPGSGAPQPSDGAGMLLASARSLCGLKKVHLPGGRSPTARGDDGPFLCEKNSPACRGEVSDCGRARGVARSGRAPSLASLSPFVQRVTRRTVRGGPEPSGSLGTVAFLRVLAPTESFRDTDPVGTLLVKSFQLCSTSAVGDLPLGRRLLHLRAPVRTCAHLHRAALPARSGPPARGHPS